VSILHKRLAAFAACLALIGAIDGAAARRQLDAGCGSATLIDRTDSAPAALSIGWTSATVFASARTQRLNHVHPATAGSRAVVAAAERAMRVADNSIGPAVSLPIRSRAGRGPPSHVLS
jgi:hypothetical protein